MLAAPAGSDIGEATEYACGYATAEDDAFEERSVPEGRAASIPMPERPAPQG